jgi:hypothetical protein
LLQVCYQNNSQDPDVASDALALAGVIRARDGQIYDAASQLTEIVLRAENRCLLWRFPTAIGHSFEAGLVDTDLSAIWREVTEKYLTGGGCRLRVLPGALSSDQCMDAVRQLLQSGGSDHGAADTRYRGNRDWRSVPASTVASVTVYVNRACIEHKWRWPMGVMCEDMPLIDETQEPFARKLATLVNDPFMAPPPDLLICNTSLSDRGGSSVTSGGLKLSVAEPEAPNPSLPPLRVVQVLDEKTLLPLRPEALLSAPQDAMPDFLCHYVYGLSHDAPPDVALFDAWFRMSPRPEAPLILMAPAIGFDADMENARLRNCLSETVGRLGQIFATSSRFDYPLVIDITSAMAQAFGLSVSAANVPLADVFSELFENLLTGRIRFDNESDTGENLTALKAEADRVSREIGDRMETFGAGTVLPGMATPAARASIRDDGAWLFADAFEDEAFDAPAPEVTRSKLSKLSRLTIPMMSEVSQIGAPTPSGETDRYIDPVFYYDHLAAGDAPAAAEIVADGEALEEQSQYTLEIAIRADRIGIDLDADAPATLTPRREAQESVTVYARVESLDEDLLTFEDGFLPLTWPFDHDSTPAFFRCETGRGARGRNVVDVEVLIYSEDLHLLEVMTIRDVVIGDNPERLSRHKHWPQDRPTALSPAAEEEPVSLSLRIKGVPMGFTAEAIFRLGPDRLRPIPLGRTILADDIRALLVQVRDFWTGLVVGDLSAREKLFNYQYEKCLDQMWGFGGSAWRLFFGNDRDAGASALGDLIRAVDLPKDSVIQISCREDARHFVFPWALMRPDPAPEGGRDPQAIWGLRFMVEQINRKGARNLGLSDAPVRIASVIDPGFAGVVPHQETLDRVVGQGGWATLNPLTTQADVQASLSGSQPAQLYYFFCQGFTPGENPHLAADHIKTLRDQAAASDEGQVWDTLLNRLSTPPGEAKMFFGTASITETELNDIDFFQGRSRPIVFLNMCHSADLLPGMGHGMTRRFIERNASAVVGTECPMTAVFADLFAGKVIEELGAHKTIGQAILGARRHFHEARNPLGFAYTLYGRSDARLGLEIPEIPAFLRRRAT